MLGVVVVRFEVMRKLVYGVKSCEGVSKVTSVGVERRRWKIPGCLANQTFTNMISNVATYCVQALLDALPSQRYHSLSNPCFRLHWVAGEALDGHGMVLSHLVSFICL